MTLSESAPADLTTTQERLLRTLAWGREGKEPSGIAALSGLAESTVRRHLPLLREQDLVRGPMLYGSWYLTDPGKRLAAELNAAQAVPDWMSEGHKQLLRAMNTGAVISGAVEDFARASDLSPQETLRYLADLQEHGLVLEPSGLGWWELTPEGRNFSAV